MTATHRFRLILFIVLTFSRHWVRTVCQECLDHLLFLNQCSLVLVLKEYIHVYNAARPH
jgi:hypothetical protein